MVPFALLKLKPDHSCAVQLVGRELIYRAIFFEPMLSALPRHLTPLVPFHAFIWPFLDALQHALDALIDDPSAHNSAFVEDARRDDEMKQFQKLCKAALHRAGTGGSGVRSPMSALAYIYEDTSVFLRAICTWLPQCSVTAFARAVDIVFLQRKAAIYDMIRKYVTDAIRVCVLQAFGVSFERCLTRRCPCMRDAARLHTVDVVWLSWWKVVLDRGGSGVHSPMAVLAYIYEDTSVFLCAICLQLPQCSVAAFAHAVDICSCSRRP
jgi:hypothetical protein